MVDSRANVNLIPPGYTRNGTLENPRKLFNQDFDRLRDFYLKNDLLFEDENFPADPISIGPKLYAQFNTQNIEWRRPQELMYKGLPLKPYFIVDDMSIFDIKQTHLGDCWVLSAIGALSLNSQLIKNVVPSDQGFIKKYAGIFHFRLWHLGEWVDIVIDDSLPFLNGNYLSVKPSCGNEFWPCLLEKAYAKLLGSYQNLHWGNPAEAFVNLTGGVTMTFDLQNSNVHPNDLWQMVKLVTEGTLIGCTYNNSDGTNRKRSSSVPIVKENVAVRQFSLPESKIPENERLDSGLVNKHAYCVTNIAQVQCKEGLVKLIRIWNPWGYGEWEGNWNDKSPRWKELREEDRKKLLRVREDGEFWMSWEDFLAEFSCIIICNKDPVYLDWGDQPKKWYKHMFWNKWPKEESQWNICDTGCFSRNPQYSITVTASDEVVKGYNVMVSLMQSKRNRQKGGGDWLPIGFLLLRVDVPNSQEKLPASFFKPEKLKSIQISKCRDITRIFNLASGSYVIIPYTTTREQDSSFLLQIFLKSKNCAIELGVVRPKSNETQIYENIFRKFATKDSKMNASDLQRYLNDVFITESGFSNGVKFNIDGSRLLLASVDDAGRGTLNGESFYTLWRLLNQFKDLFAEIDVSRCGYFSLSELCKAVSLTGLQVTIYLLKQLVARYGDAEEKINFVDYLLCMVRLKTVAKTFKMLSSNENGVFINREKWMQLMI